MSLASMSSAFAQDLTPANEPPLTDASQEKEGLLREPDAIQRAVVTVDRRFNSGEVTEGPHLVFGNMIPGAGWISGGPGYRQWYAKDHLFFDSSAQLSMRGYKAAQARVELPRLAGGTLLVGSLAGWQDFTQVNYFGEGSASLRSNQSEYGIQSRVLGGYATVRPTPILSINVEAGWLQPSIGEPSGPFRRSLPDTRELFSADPVYALRDQPTFFYRRASITVDNRDFPGHPTAGGVYRAGIADYSDRGAGIFNFSLYEAEAAHFTPLGGSGVVLALHGWVVGSNASDGQTVPFYLQPSLGGLNTLRGYDDYRFHDRDLMLVNAEVRVPLMTHIDAGAFLDLGNVAPRIGDLDLQKSSYGFGFRLHSRRQTFARLDIARSKQGWMFVLRLNDPLNLTRLTRQTPTAPFVP
jgi:surface antigen Omp85-like protein